MEEKTNAIIEAIIVISSIFVVVAAFVIAYFIYFKHRKENMARENKELRESFQTQLLQSRIEVQEQTFQQIGKELHDNVGQLLSTSRMLLGLTERSFTTPPDTLLTANATLGQAINEIRSLAKTLDKDWLERFSFDENMQTMVERINAGKTIEAAYVQSIHLPLQSDEQIILFRIVQEAIQNALKHASASQLRITIEEKEERYLISVSDNGKGFHMDAVTKSLGIANMQQRVQLLRGTLAVNTVPGKGTTITIQLPAIQNN